jgi:hypothetical protein
MLAAKELNIKISKEHVNELNPPPSVLCSFVGHGDIPYDIWFYFWEDITRIPEMDFVHHLPCDFNPRYPHPALCETNQVTASHDCLAA